MCFSFKTEKIVDVSFFLKSGNKTLPYIRNLKLVINVFYFFAKTCICILCLLK